MELKFLDHNEISERKNGTQSHYKVLNLLIFFLIIIILSIFVPILSEKFFIWTFEKPFSEQRIAISESNKTSDTASGIIGTYVNNIPLNDFEKITNLSSKSFKSVDIQIPSIYISSPIFNTEKYGEQLQDIWLSSIHEDELINEYKHYSIYYNKNKIKDDNGTYSHKDATADEVKQMKKEIVRELETNSKFSKFKFHKWYESKNASNPTNSSTTDKKHYSFSSTYEFKDHKMNIFGGAAYKDVTASFVKKDGKIILKEGSLKVR
ncbi:hypothetical protein [Streptococcus uberis]|uniref:hypothetical protein n=1 Tax=Streptococcus uberis TaxID=1349 RepID=UPI0019398BFD|nr:hypothetical protein [Streptococcus uberis]